jgi:hypothetical protein
MAPKLSSLAYELKDVIVEVDKNPVIVNPTGAVAVDALVVLRKLCLDNLRHPKLDPGIFAIDEANENRHPYRTI